MTQQQEIAIRRAKPSDTAKIVAFVNNVWASERRINDISVIERFGNVGFLVAERDDAIVGLLGWQAENLVVRVTDFLVGSASERFDIGQPLLAEMEQAARELECEVTLLFLPRPAPPALIEFWETLGYEGQAVTDLPKAWKEAASKSHMEADDIVLLKKLRERRVLRPM